MENLENLDFFDQQPPRPIRIKKIAALALLVLILAFVVYKGYGYWLKSGQNSGATQYHVLFLEGGQTYFGKIESEDRHYITLAHAHYLQVAEREERDIRGRIVKVPSLNAIRVGTETHAPKTTIRVNRDRIMIIEELEQNSQFISLIEQPQASPDMIPSP